MSNKSKKSEKNKEELAPVPVVLNPGVRGYLNARLVRSRVTAKVMVMGEGAESEVYLEAFDVENMKKAILVLQEITESRNWQFVPSGFTSENRPFSRIVGGA